MPSTPPPGAVSDRMMAALDVAADVVRLALHRTPQPERARMRCN
jgi:hypothetical protein